MNNSLNTPFTYTRRLREDGLYDHVVESDSGRVIGSIHSRRSYTHAIVVVAQNLVGVYSWHVSAGDASAEIADVQDDFREVRFFVIERQDEPWSTPRRAQEA